MKLKMTLLAGLVVSQFAVADDHFRQHDAHVHGHVEFNIVEHVNVFLFVSFVVSADGIH